MACLQVVFGVCRAVRLLFQNITRDKITLRDWHVVREVGEALRCTLQAYSAVHIALESPINVGSQSRMRGRGIVIKSGL